MKQTIADEMIDALRAENTKLKAALVEAQWLAKTLAPGMRHLFNLDYERLNTALIAVDSIRVAEPGGSHCTGHVDYAPESRKP